MYMRETVKDGSTITLSPCRVVMTKILVRLYCSAINGEMFDLKKPVPVYHKQTCKKKKKARSGQRTETSYYHSHNKRADSALFLDDTG